MSTYRIEEALDIVKRSVGNPGADTFGTRAADQAVGAMWRAAPWPESLDEFDPFNLVPEVQDYKEPLANIPSDIHGFWRTELVTLQSDGSFGYDELEIMKQIEPSHVPRSPGAISYNQDGKFYRLSNPTPSNFAGPTNFIRGTYKKRHTQITNANINNAVLPWDDDLFSVYVEVLRWKMYALLGSERAITQGQIARLMIEEAASQQGLYLGHTQQRPDIDVGAF